MDEPPESKEVPVLCLQQLEKDTIFLGLERTVLIHFDISVLLCMQV